MNDPCPVCDLSGGFHDDDLHAARVTVPRHKLLPIGSEIRKAQEGVCGNCGALFTEAAIPPCRNPAHAK